MLHKTAGRRGGKIYIEIARPRSPRSSFLVPPDVVGNYFITHGRARQTVNIGATRAFTEERRHTGALFTRLISRHASRE